MGERMTVIGGTDSTIAVTLDGTQALKLAKQFSQELQNYYSADQLNYFNVTADGAAHVENKIAYGQITAGGAYTAGNGYDYIVAGGYNFGSPTMGLTDTDINNLGLLESKVSIKSTMTSGQSVKVLAGNLQGFTYDGSEGQENGQLAAGSVNNSVYFLGNTVNGGNWDIRTGKGNDTIVTGSGNNTVQADKGINSINITAGNTNQVISEGQDSIFAAANSTAQNRVSLNGGYSTVNINKGAGVNDYSSYNAVTVGGGSTIAGGSYGNYTFDGSYDSSLNYMVDGQNSTITATGDLQVVQGNTNTINASQSLSFFNGVGDIEATAAGHAIGFGADGLNYTLDITNASAGGMFVADAGNETLNASGSTTGLEIYANTVVGGSAANNKFVATGGSGNDTIVAGTGQSTFSGGAGDNLFMFTKDVAEGGNTVITDFANSSQNKIALYNYGLDNDSLAALLNDATNDTQGNAVLNLDGHTITIEGVAVSDLNVTQFEVANASK